MPHRCCLVQTNFERILTLYEEHPLIERLNRVIAEDFFVKKERREMSLVMNDASERYALFSAGISGHRESGCPVPRGFLPGYHPHAAQ